MKKPIWKTMRKTGKARIKAKYPLLPIDYQSINYTPEELWKKAIEYFTYCDKYDKPKTLSWLCISCGVDDWFFNEKRESQQFSRVVDQINLILENYLEEQLLTGKNWTNVQFILNNRFKGKWRNSSNMKVETPTVLPEIKDILDGIIYWKKPTT